MYSKTCVRQPPLKLTLVVDVERWLSNKGTCHVISLAKLNDMYLYKTHNFFHINHYSKSVSKVALLHRFYCSYNLTELVPQVSTCLYLFVCLYNLIVTWTKTHEEYFYQCTSCMIELELGRKWNLTLVLLNKDMPYLCELCKSRSSLGQLLAFRSQPIWICTAFHLICEFVSIT